MRSLFLVISVFLNAGAFAQTNYLSQLAYSRQFTLLEEVLSSNPANKNDKLLYAVFTANAFNQPVTADNLLRQIFAKKIAANDDTMQFHLHQIAYSNAVLQNNYADAYKFSEKIIHNYAAFLPDAELQSQKDESIIWNFLSAVPKQRIVKSKTSTIPLKKDMAGLWNIPVMQQDSSYQFIFDTGAGISTITDSYAKKLNIAIINNSSVNVVGGITGINNKARLGIAKLLTIGNIKIFNAVFLVLPDSALSFANGAYKINGIMGLPVIKALEEIIIRKEEMEIPAVANRTVSKHNFALDMLTPVIYMSYKKQPLPFTFDSGAQQSLFSDNFYSKYKGEWKDAVADSANIGGAGGSKVLKMIEIPSLSFTIDSKQAIFSKAQISLEQLEANKEFYYGNIGQDLIDQFTSMKINFANSTITFLK